LSTTDLIRRSQPGDAPKLSALFREAFGTERSEEIWRWKYFGQRPGVGYVCETGGRIVAHCGGIPVQFRDGSRRYLAYQSVDFMSSPAHAGGLGGGGVFVRTVRRMFEECCGPDKALLVYGFPGERHRLVGERLLGYRPLEPVTELELTHRGASIRPEPLSQRLLPLFTKQEMRFGALRDEVYLAWRYLAHPFHRYGVVTARARWPFAAQAAALVREIEDAFVILELRVSGPTARALTRRLSELGKPVRIWSSARHPLGLLLAEHGFRSMPRDHQVEYRFFFERSTPQPGELYYTLGDYDVH
jgi:hypothetical protein